MGNALSIIVPVVIAVVGGLVAVAYKDPEFFLDVLLPGILKVGVCLVLVGIGAGVGVKLSESIPVLEWLDWGAMIASLSFFGLMALMSLAQAKKHHQRGNNRPTT